MKYSGVTLINFLRQPYPYYFKQNRLGRLLLAIFFLGFFFLHFFEPFNVYPQEHKFSYFWISFLHAAVSCTIFYSSYSAVNFLKIEEEKWTIGKEIFSLGLVLLLMGLGNFFLRNLIYNNPNNASWQKEADTNLHRKE